MQSAIMRENWGCLQELGEEHSHLPAGERGREDVHWTETLKELSMSQPGGGDGARVIDMAGNDMFKGQEAREGAVLPGAAGGSVPLNCKMIVDDA